MRFISVFTSGVTEGILVAVLIAVTPAMLGLPDAMALRFKQRFDPLVDRINPPFVALAAISAVLVLIMADLSSTATVFAAVGIAGGLGVAVTSLGFNLRINREMASWPADAPPEAFRP